MRGKELCEISKSEMLASECDPGGKIYKKMGKWGKGCQCGGSASGSDEPPGPPWAQQ